MKKVAKIIHEKIPANSNVIITGHSQGSEDAIVLHQVFKASGKYRSLDGINPILFCPKLSAACETELNSQRAMCFDFYSHENPRLSLTRCMEWIGHAHSEKLVVDVPLQPDDAYGYVKGKGYHERKFKLDPIWRYHGNSECFSALIQASARAMQPPHA